MANQAHLDILKQGVKAWNEWRDRDLGTLPDLYKADLRKQDLAKADLREANLCKADLREANLCKADLTGAYLTWANLCKADLTGAYLTWTYLGGADLTGANLSRANLSEANLRGANLSEANIYGANLTGANLSEANLRGANLNRAFLINATLVETDLDSADLTGCHVYGISAWNVKVNKDTKQSSLIITQIGEPTITVPDLEVAQFIYLLLNNEKVRHVIDTMTSKVVLILGRFTPERKAVLDAIREELRQHNYVPILFDFDKPATRDTHETITTLARLARFVIADITSPKSIPQELVSIVETMPSLPIQPLLKKGARPWDMYDHIKGYPWVLERHKYRDLDDLLGSLKERVIAPAENKVAELTSRDNRK